MTSTRESVLIDISDTNLTLSSRAGAVDILRDINLAIHTGETVGIVGPSGSGKTSLLMVMAGLEQVTSGRVMFADHEMSALDEDQLALIRGEHIGIVFQSFNLVPTMTALENTALPLEFAGATEPFERARALLEDVGLEHRNDHFPAQLSGGERQRVALARALASKPSLLLADEPTGNLDGQTGGEVIDLIFDLHKTHNTTLVLVTHDETLAGRCQRQIKIEDGCVKSTYNPTIAEVG
ncbi:MAG: ATP-binding cassette domain-containing protein [bacterium]|nr:ATP-binding cassette domain-containing protein [bacterium]